MFMQSNDSCLIIEQLNSITAAASALLIYLRKEMQHVFCYEHYAPDSMWKAEKYAGSFQS